MHCRWFTLLVLTAIVTTGVIAIGATYREKLDAVWGKDMTVEQFLRAVEPELLGSTTARMRATKVTWCRSAGSAVTAHYVGPVVASDSLSAGELGILASQPAISWDYENNGIQCYGYVVSYGAKTTITSPWHYCVPYMWLRARLLYDGRTVGSRIVEKNNVWRVSIASSYDMTGPGIYQCISYHYIQFPAGYDLPDIYFIYESPESTILW
jgi:hypothetical protein